MRAIIFAGPTIRKSDIIRLCDATILPPAAMGDVYRAVAEGILSADIGRDLVGLAKQQFYKERNWETLFRLGHAAGMSLDAFAKWQPANTVDLKRDDALKMAAAMAEFLVKPHAPS